MRIKRFEASDTYSAMAMVKEELGEDAVILSTRSLPGKPGSARGSGPRIEVVAAMEYDPEPEDYPAAPGRKRLGRPAAKDGGLRIPVRASGPGKNNTASGRFEAGHSSARL